MAKTTVVTHDRDLTNYTAFKYPYDDGYEYWAIHFDGQSIETDADGIDGLVTFLKKIQKTRKNKGK